MSNTEYVTVEKRVYEGLVEDHKFLQALFAAGVDNWDGYDYANEILQEEMENDS